jgi:proteasome lid subunit RPN8/RPN11
LADRRLLIAHSLLDRLRQMARAAAPEECCGLLLGRRAPVAIVTELLPAANIHPEPERFFTIDPARQFALLRELRETGREDRLLGLYHSHPQGPAAPSPRDLAEANDADMIWLVIDSAGGAIGAFQPETDASGRVAAFTVMDLIATPSQIP